MNTQTNSKHADAFAVISQAILAHLSTGKSLPEAMDIVLGSGRFEQFASDLWEALRAK